ncbi:hypothetical protein MRX96_037933 [Rhipicephalus microplus]
MDVCPEETPQPSKLGDIILPSPLCSKVVLPSEPTALCFAWHTSSEPGDLRVMKHVTISACTEATAAQKNSFLCTVFCRGIKTVELPVNNECDAADTLKKADGLKLCPGCGIAPVASGQCVKFGAAHFAKNCLVTSPDGKPCLRWNWTQILRVFSSKGNVKVNILSKILLVATVLAEKSGLFVDYWTSDGAPWNRSLWKLFGIKTSIKEINAPQRMVQPFRSGALKYGALVLREHVGVAEA